VEGEEDRYIVVATTRPETIHGCMRQPQRPALHVAQREARNRAEGGPIRTRHNGRIR
jgi:hypothetical protein